MKTVTISDFYQDAGLVDQLAEGEQLVVTADGKPKFVVSKSSRPKMTRRLAEERAVGDASEPKVDLTAFLASLKK
jgi:antitoxin (DNA-binding transcriptional repressor) of toxin-antitoxin stability system